MDITTRVEFMCVLPDGRLHSIVRASYPVLISASTYDCNSLFKDDYIEDLRTMTEYARQLFKGFHSTGNTNCIFVRRINSTSP